MRFYVIYKMIKLMYIKKKIPVFILNETFGNNYYLNDFKNLCSFYNRFIILNMKLNQFHQVNLDVCINTYLESSKIKTGHLTQLRFKNEYNGNDWFKNKIYCPSSVLSFLY